MLVCVYFVLPVDLYCCFALILNLYSSLIWFSKTRCCDKQSYHDTLFVLLLWLLRTSFAETFMCIYNAFHCFLCCCFFSWTGSQASTVDKEVSWNPTCTRPCSPVNFQDKFIFILSQLTLIVPTSSSRQSSCSYRYLNIHESAHCSIVSLQVMGLLSSSSDEMKDQGPTCFCMWKMPWQWGSCPGKNISKFHLC